MAVLDGFWHGAILHGARLDLVGLAEAAGGWRALREGGYAALVQAGVGKARARAWSLEGELTCAGTPVNLGSADYPSALRCTPRPPPVIFVEGQLDALQRAAVAVVGTRRCTTYGRGVSYHLGSALAASGLCVVSGLARGIDTAAHLGALEHGVTVAVLGHGLGMTSPSSNRRLRERIVEQGGAVISTFFDDFRPTRFSFPIRNQWIAGLSMAVVVVEAPARSGALITAELALDQGRDVYAVPGPIGADASAGCNRLLAQGAGVVVDVEGLVGRFATPALPSREDWLEGLFNGRAVDEVARSFGLSTTEVLTRLALLEVEGRVVRLPGQRYAPGGSPL